MTKAEKILLTLARLSGQRQEPVAYEHLVVAAFEAYPDDFGLRGYPQYPDASDLHKPIYNYLRPQGLVRVAQKTFRITEAGLREAAALQAAHRGNRITGTASRPTRSQERAIRRYATSAAARLVADGRADDLIDTDCQRFYGFAPWTKPREATALRADFLSALDMLRRSDKKLAQILRKTDMELFNRFTHLFEEAPSEDPT